MQLVKRRPEFKQHTQSSIIKTKLTLLFADIESKTYSGAWYPNVPRTRVECKRAAISGAWFDKLKSAIFETYPSKSRTLLDFISRWMMAGWAFSCKYSRPLAAPTAIFTRCIQSSTGPGCAPFTPFLPALRNIYCQCQCPGNLSVPRWFVNREE